MPADVPALALPFEALVKRTVNEFESPRFVACGEIGPRSADELYMI
jgi:hypothetical protein